MQLPDVAQLLTFANAFLAILTTRTGQITFHAAAIFPHAPSHMSEGQALAPCSSVPN